MTVDIATIAPTGNGLARALPGIMPDVTTEALDRLERWVHAASNAHKLVAPLIGTPWVPAAYQPKVDPRASDEEKARAFEIAVASGTAAVLYGSSLGIDPLMALQQVYVISGRPALYAKMMVALVQSRGHEVWTEDQSDTRAVVCGRRKGSTHTERITITMDMARKAGWTRNQKYAETPQDMLWARAASRVCDRIASDVLKGIPSVEEAQDDEVLRAAAEVGQRTVRAPKPRPALPAAEEPPLDVDEVTAPVPVAAEEPTEEPATPMMTGPQQRKLHALLKESDRGDRDVGLVYIAGVIDRQVESTKDLTKVEAGRVIDALEAEQSEPSLVEP